MTTSMKLATRSYPPESPLGMMEAWVIVAARPKDQWPVESESRALLRLLPAAWSQIKAAGRSEDLEECIAKRLEAAESLFVGDLGSLLWESCREVLRDCHRSYSTMGGKAAVDVEVEAIDYHSSDAVVENRWREALAAVVEALERRSLGAGSFFSLAVLALEWRGNEPVMPSIREEFDRLRNTWFPPSGHVQP